MEWIPQQGENVWKQGILAKLWVDYAQLKQSKAL